MSTDYSKLTAQEQEEVIKKIHREIPVAHHINKSNGFEWDEPEHTITNVKNDYYCAICWRSYYTCLCGHDY